MRRDVWLAARGRVLAYVAPRRFPVAAACAWAARLVAQTADYVVVDKPGGVPSTARADNAYESCLECVERAVGCRLHTLHRLDLPTHGLILFAKTLRFQAHFLAGMRAGAISKRYRALVQSRRPRGPGGGGGGGGGGADGLPAHTTITHYMQPSSFSPKVVSAAKRRGWLECRIRI